MADNNNNQFNPWEFFGQNGNGMPGGDWQNPDMTWVKDYVQDVMKQAFPGQFGEGEFRGNSGSGSRRGKSNLSTDVFETHHFIITRINVPEDILAENIRVMFHTNELKIEGVDSEPQIVRLPANGLYKGSKAMFKDNVLEIRIPKRSREQFQEIPIQG